MKYRTFLTTLLLFLVTINFGITLIAIHTYRDTVEQAKKYAAADHYFISSGILKDIRALDTRGVDYTKGIVDLIQPYGYLAWNQKGELALYEGNDLIYTTINGGSISDISPVTSKGERIITLKKQDTGIGVFVIGSLPQPYDNYVLLYRSDVSDTLHGWYRVKNTMFTIGVFLSGILAICLHLLLNKLFRPLVDISRTSRQIAKGEYTTRLIVKGTDEIAEVANNFNRMAEEIERQMDELKTTAENKQLFIDNFAHELKTPLTAIYGYAEYLQKACLPESDRHFALDCIISESRRMQTMAYQMMELANLRNDQISMEHVSVSELFKTIRRTMMSKISEKNINLQFCCEFPTIYGDAVLLESLLINLIDNAVKASSQGGSIWVHFFIDGGNPVLTVRDHGKGMPKEAIDRVTQPYYRVETHRNRGEGGAGLGLAICAQIAERHRAKLDFSSSLGKGTTVNVIFTT